MRIAVLGATGRTGAEVLRRALERGHEVVGYARRPHAVPAGPGVTVQGGQLSDQFALTAALTGCDAVVVTVGPSLMTLRPRLMRTAMPTVIAAMHAASVRRIVVLSALGVGVTRANTRFPYSWAAPTLMAGVFADHDRGESLLERSGLDWTTVHPGPLTNGHQTDHPMIIDAAVGRRLPGIPRTSRADVAEAMLDMIDDENSFGRRMLITSAVHSG